MEDFIPRKRGCLLGCLDWVPNRGACIDACLSSDVARPIQEILFFVNWLTALKHSAVDIDLSHFSLSSALKDGTGNFFYKFKTFMFVWCILIIIK